MGLVSNLFQSRIKEMDYTKSIDLLDQVNLYTGFLCRDVGYQSFL